jgi:hypothetical protein
MNVKVSRRVNSSQIRAWERQGSKKEDLRLSREEFNQYQPGMSKEKGSSLRIRKEEAVLRPCYNPIVRI